MIPLIEDGQPVSKETARQCMAAVENFFCAEQRKILLDMIDKSEESEFFCRMVHDQAHTIVNMPKNGEQDGMYDDAVVHLHYFIGGFDWWITERDNELDDQHQAFGLAHLHEAELGYICLPEILQVKMMFLHCEMDLYWKPCTLKDIKLKRGWPIITPDRKPKKLNER